MFNEKRLQIARYCETIDLIFFDYVNNFKAKLSRYDQKKSINIIAYAKKQT